MGREAGPAMDMDETGTAGLQQIPLKPAKALNNSTTSSPVLWRGPEGHRQKENPRQLGASQRALGQKSEVMA